MKEIRAFPLFLPVLAIIFLMAACPPCPGQNGVDVKLLDLRSGETKTLRGVVVDGEMLLPLAPILDEVGLPYRVDPSRIQLTFGDGRVDGTILMGAEFCLLKGALHRCVPAPRMGDQGLLVPSSMIIKISRIMGTVPISWENEVLSIGETVKIPAGEDPPSPGVVSTQPSKLFDEDVELGIVVIDPGHGGKDPGCVSPTGLKEGAVTLDVALRLKSILENDEALNLEKVVMTRERDTSVALLERAKVANASKGDLFLSLHTNSSLSKYASGVETYFVSQTDDASSLEVQSRENAVMDLDIEGGVSGGEGVSLEAILLDLQYMEYVRESQILGSLVQKNVCNATATRDRGVRQALFYVLRGASMPSVLVEMGFMTNASEERRLSTPGYRQKLAEGLARSVVSYSKQLKTELGVPEARSVAPVPSP